MKKSRWSSWMSSIASLKNKMSGSSVQQKKPRALKSRGLQLEPLEQRQMLSITVNSLLGNVDSDPTTTTLYEAINTANATAGTDTIEFDPTLFSGGDQTITMEDGQFSITDDVIIDGPGAGLLTIDADELSRIFYVDGVEATFSDMTITGGSADHGAGIYVNTDSDITINNAVITGNSGGGDLVELFGGGGVYAVDSEVEINNSTISSNTALIAGGLLATDSIVEINNSTITANTGTIYGGLVLFESITTINDSTVSGNTGTWVGGGLSSSSGTIEINRSSISSNISGNNTGGIYVSDCPIEINDSVISNNSADYNGGGIYSVNAAVTVNRSRIFGNTAARDGGGIYLSDNASTIVSNSLIYGNTASDQGGGIFGDGDYSDDGDDTNDEIVSIELINSTITANTAATGGGVYSEDWDDISLANTIVAQNTATTSDPDIHGAIDTDTNNLIGIWSDSSTPGANTIHGTSSYPIDPHFIEVPTAGSDATWGTSDDTGDLALTLFSPAINAGDNTAASGLTVDLADNDRLIHEIVDIGAYEYSGGLDIIVSTLNYGCNGDYTYGDLSLHEAIGMANGTAIHTITFDPALFVDENGDSLPGTITLGGINLRIADDIVIAGPGADLLTIDANERSRVFYIDEDIEVTLSGMTITGGYESDDDGGGIYVDTGSTVEINNSIITNNSAEDGAGIYVYQYSTIEINNSTITNNSAAEDGAGIRSLRDNTIEINNSTITNNSAESGAGIHAGNNSAIEINNSTISDNLTSGIGGGIIAYGGTIDINASVISNNVAHGAGGGIYSYGSEISILASTLFGNEVATVEGFAVGHGGGICLDGRSSATIANTALFGNTAAYCGGGICVVGSYSDDGDDTNDYIVTLEVINSTIAANMAATGGGICTSDWYGITSDWNDISLANTIVAQNTANTSDPDIYGTIDTDTNNLIGIWTDSSTPGTNTLYGTTSDPLDPGFVETPFAGTDGIWGTADDEGDLHLTVASSAINAGDNASASGLTTDLDGNDRIIYETVDMGVYEYDGDILVSTLADESDGNYSYGDLSFREALYLANQTTEADTIEFAPSMFVDGNDDPLPGSITLDGTQLDVDSDVTITGPGANLLTIDANDLSRVFYVDVDVAATFSDMTITGGLSTAGSGIYGDSGSEITINDVAITGNSASDAGSGLRLVESSVTITDSVFSENTATYGAGIAFLDCTSITISGTIFSGNTASTHGGGIYVDGSALDIVGSTFSNNTASSYGGGIYSYDSILDISDTTFFGNTASNGGGVHACEGSTAAIANSALFGNTASSYGGGIYAEGSVSSLTAVDLINNTITANDATNGGGLYRGTDSNITSANTIIALNTATSNPDIYGTLATDSNNLIGTDPLFVENPSAGTDGIWGTADDEGDLSLSSASTAINGGQNVLAISMAYDIDGATRIEQGTVDVGAKEAIQVGSQAGYIYILDNIDLTDYTYGQYDYSDAIPVTEPGDVDDGNYYYGYLTLREAITLANSSAGVDAIFFEASYFTNESDRTITLDDSNNNIDRGLVVAESVVIEGDIDGNLPTIDADGESRVFSVENDATLTLSDMIITGGETEGNGGGIFAEGSVVLANVTVEDNQAYKGGGIYASSLDATDSTISYNSADIGGGGIYGDSSTISLNDVSVYVNSISSVYSRGGGIYLTSSALTVSNGSSITGNSCTNSSYYTGSGGGVYSSDSTVTIEDSAVAFNSTGSNGGDGGGIYSSNSTIILDNADISHNTSHGSGGGIVILNGSTLLVDGSEITQNNTTNGAGGGIASWDSFVSLGNDTEIFNNYSRDYGGGISLGRSTFEASDSKISDNSTPEHGGGVNVSHSQISLDNVIISGNSSYREGGGILLDYNSDAEIKNSTLFNNTALSGGGVFAVGWEAVGYNSSLLISNTAIFGNTAERKGAGLQLSLDVDATILNSSIYGNVLTSSDSSYDSLGGGIYTSGANHDDSDPPYRAVPYIQIVNSTIAANSADEGGGVYVDSWSDVAVINSIVAQNTSTSTTSPSPDVYGSLTFGVSCDLGCNTNLPSDYNLVGVWSNDLVPASNTLYGTESDPLDPQFLELPEAGEDEVWGTEDDLGDLRLSETSPAIDVGSNEAVLDYRLRRDLDNKPRVLGGTVDLGVYEYGEEGVMFLVVTTLDDVVDENDGEFSLREAIEMANENPGADTIAFDPEMFLSGAATITLDDDFLPDEVPLLIADDLIIDGPVDQDGNSLLKIDANNLDRAFTVARKAEASEVPEVFFCDMTIANGGIEVTNSSLQLAGVSFVEGTKTDDGSFIYVNSGGVVTLTDSTIADLLRSTIGQIQVDSGGSLYINVGGLNPWTVSDIDSLLDATTSSSSTDFAFSVGSAFGIDTTGYFDEATEEPFFAYSYKTSDIRNFDFIKLGTGTLSLEGYENGGTYYGHAGDTEVRDGTLTLGDFWDGTQTLTVVGSGVANYESKTLSGVASAVSGSEVSLAWAGLPSDAVKYLYQVSFDEGENYTTILDSTTTSSLNAPSHSLLVSGIPVYSDCYQRIVAERSGGAKVIYQGVVSKPNVQSLGGVFQIDSLLEDDLNGPSLPAVKSQAADVAGAFSDPVIATWGTDGTNSPSVKIFAISYNPCDIPCSNESPYEPASSYVSFIVDKSLVYADSPQGAILQSMSGLIFDGSVPEYIPGEGVKIWRYVGIYGPNHETPEVRYNFYSFRRYSEAELASGGYSHLERNEISYTVNVKGGSLTGLAGLGGCPVISSGSGNDPECGTPSTASGASTLGVEAIDKNGSAASSCGKSCSDGLTYDSREVGFDTGFGPGWSDVDELPELLIARNAVVARFGAELTIVFDKQDSGTEVTYVAQNDGKDVLVHNETTGLYILSTTDGTTYEFFDETSAFYSIDSDLNTTSDISVSGCLYRSIASDGTTIEVADWDSSNRVVTVLNRISPDSDAYQKREFTYVTGTDRVQTITLFEYNETTTTWDNVRRITYDYYEAGDAYGLDGDLKTIYTQEWDNTLATPDWADGDTNYFRYYTDESEDGYLAHGLKRALLAEAYESAEAYAESLSITVDDLTDEQIADYTCFYYEYDAEGRVTERVVFGGTSATSYENFISTNATTGYNSWYRKSVETQLNGTTYTVYTNHLGAVLLADLYDPVADTHTIEYNRYDEAGRQFFTTDTSAFELVEGKYYDDSLADLVGYDSGNSPYLSNADGLFSMTSYYGTTNNDGAADGYIHQKAIAQGENATRIAFGGTNGPVVLVGYEYEERAYEVNTVGSDTINNKIYVISKEITYDGHGDDGNDLATTEYDSIWYDDTCQVKEITVELPAVSTAQNGSGTIDTIKQWYDSDGNLIWTMDSLGRVTYQEYDSAGRVAKVIEDIDAATVSSLSIALPTSDSDWDWTLPANDGINAVTEYEYDIFGRITKTLGPEHTASMDTKIDSDFDGIIDDGDEDGDLELPTPTTVRTATWTFYDDVNHEIRSAQGYVTVSTGAETILCPVSIIKTDRDGRITEEIEAAYSGTVDDLATAEFTQYKYLYVEDGDGDDSNNYIFQDNYYTAWTTYQYTNTRLTSMRAYHTIPDSGIGVADGESYNSNYELTTYSYENYDDSTQMGRMNKIVTPDGTITRYVFDGRGNIIETWMGTDDTGATDDTPCPTGTGENNMVHVVSYTYDADGYLTSTTEYPGGFASNLTTTYQYDWLGRVTDVRTPDNVVTHYEYDNLGQTLLTETYASADFTLDTSELRARTEYSYDALGRVYETTAYEVNPTTGAVGDSLSANTWYDERGQIIKTSDSAGLFQKYDYDSLGRMTNTYLCFDASAGEASYASAHNVTGDTVIEQSQVWYDDASNVLLTAAYLRLTDDITTTGELDATNSYATASAIWHDGIGRTIATADYGREDVDADSSWTRYIFHRVGGSDGGGNYSAGDLKDADRDGIPDVIENATPLPYMTVRLTADPDDDVMSSSGAGEDFQLQRIKYGKHGHVSMTYDNVGHRNVTYYDDLGRLDVTVENFTDGTWSDGNTDQDIHTFYEYDGGRLITVIRNNSEVGETGTRNQYTKYLYESTVNASWQTAVVYHDSEDSVNTSYGSNLWEITTDNGDHVSTSYDQLGRVTSTTDQRGVTHTYTYDTAGRLWADTVTSFGTSGEVDNTVQRVGTTYDDIGRVAAITNYSDTSGTTALNQVAYAYDGWGNVYREYQEHDGVVDASTPFAQYNYVDGASGGEAKYVRLDEIVYPDGRSVQYDYGSTGAIDDIMSRITSINDGTTTYASYRYLGADTIVEENYDDIDVKLSYLDSSDDVAGLDRFGRVVDQIWENSASQILDEYKYGYDQVGNRNWKENVVSGNLGTPVHLDELYTYDDIGRLLSVDRGNLVDGQNGKVISGTPNFTQDWTLDELGNWAVFNDDGDSQTREFNKANEITAITGGEVTPTYDRAGNMISGPSPTDGTVRVHYKYDAWNRLVAVYTDDASDPGTPDEVIAEYEYDALSRRIVKATYSSGALSETRHFFYNQAWQCLEERLETSGVIASTADTEYIWGLMYIDEMIARVQGDAQGDTFTYALHDANFNVTAIVDSTGTVLERYAYTAYGEVTFYNASFTELAASAEDWQYLYTGRRLDAETGLMYYRNRYYDTDLGRFISRDPMGYAAGDMNLYGYVGEGPVSKTDPFGLDESKNDVPTPWEAFKWFAKNFWGGAWIPGAVAAVPEGMKQTSEELAKLYGDAQSADLDRQVLERRLRNLRTPEDYRRIYGEQWKQAMDQTARLANVGVQANLIIAGKIIQPGTILPSGCEKVASYMQKKVGGKTVTITPKRGRYLGGFAEAKPTWQYHKVVVSGDRVYDSYTGTRGMLIEDYKKLWENANDIDFDF